MRSLTLVWVIHFHQPLGNFPEIFAEYTQSRVKPFLEALEKREGVRVNLHFGGPLLQFLDQFHPELIKLLRRLIARGQVEMVGGGFYEPVLGAIPPEDAVGQIHKMKHWLRDKLGAEARCALLAESVWHATLPVPLVSAGVDYVVLESNQLMGSGLKANELYHPYLTEWMGHALMVFPSDVTLSEHNPLTGADEIFGVLRRLANRPDSQVVTLMHNAERLVEPGFETFLDRLVTESSWIQSMPLAGVAERFPNQKVIYIPSSSGRNVASHSLPGEIKRSFDKTMTEVRHRYDAARFEPFLRAGSWSGYYTKYAEVNQMQKKMLWLRRKLMARPAGPWRDAVQNLLWAAQSHSAYWHAQAGGCYANYLRDAVYQCLLQAESRMVQATPTAWPPIETADYDADLQHEVFLRQTDWSAVVKPSYGGSMVECNFLPASSNLANTFTRREEAYHDRITFAQQVPDDWYVRHLFQDHFVKPRTTLEELSNGTFLEFGDFVDQPYHLKETRPDGITLEREGGIYVEGKRRPLLVIKNYQLVPSGGWTVTYELKNTGPLPINVHFVVENNYTCLAGDSALRVVKWNGTSRQCGEKFEIKSREKLQIQDSARGLDWTWNVSPAAQVLHYPVHTVSLQGDQPKQDYQGSALLFAWPVYLTAGDSLRFELQCQLRSLTELTAKKQENT